MPIGVYNHYKIKGHPNWNPNGKGQFKKGINTGNGFKKGHKINLGKHFTSLIKENASYSSKHSWIIRHYGNPLECEDCGLIGKKMKGRWPNGRWNIEWSNKDHKYQRKREDYNGRCFNCHINYDKENKLKKTS